MNKKLILIIMDGWGIGDGSLSDVISTAPTPYLDQLQASPEVAKSTLKACGEDVGLPVGQMGNSEVGHLNIGAGRVVYQDFVRINKAVKDNSIAANDVLNEAIQLAKSGNSKLHLMGLISDGGVHASTKHLMKIIELCTEAGLEKVYIHAITDGRDTDPKSGEGYIAELEEFLNTQTAQIATVCGRFYTMDRDKRWERVAEGYRLLVNNEGQHFTSSIEAIRSSYKEGITDEFIKPAVITDTVGAPLAKVEEDDVMLCFNFRTDRLREITTVLTQQDMPESGMKTLPLHYYTMTTYDDSFRNVKVIFDKLEVKNTLGEHLSSHGKQQIRIAETEKYPHVTFFFSGGDEKVFNGERRILIPSPKEVRTYDFKPAMSAVEITDAIIPELNKQEVDFVCLNFANGDMVGHTGVYKAITEAVETVDRCVQMVAETAIQNEYSVLISADHGNADNAVNPDGSPNTAHSLNDVPLILLDQDYKSLKDGRLADIAPTILKIMGLDIPHEMTGTILVS